MDALKKYKNNMESMISDVSQKLGPRTGAEAVKARNELMRVANEALNKDEEIDEVTGASSAGAFVAPMGWEREQGMCRQLNNEEFDNDEEIDEVTGASSAGAFVAPMGWEPQQGMCKQLNNESELDEINVGAYSQPAIWAKDYKNWKAVQDPNFPRYGGPGAKYVRIKEKCRKFPYCDQGSTSALEFYEDKSLNEILKRVSNKTNKSVNYLKSIMLQEMESIFRRDMKKYQDKKMEPYKKNKKKYTKEEIEEMIRRGFYQSPITSLVGNTKMNKPIGQIYSTKGNKPKYE